MARLSGLRGATITNIINEFIQADFVVEEGLLTGSKGRRSIGIKINGAKYKVLGIKFARKSYSLSILGMDNQLYQAKQFSFSKMTEAKDMIAEVRANAKEMIAKEEGKVLAIGVAVPGPYKKKNGKLIFMTNSAGFENIDILDEIKKVLIFPYLLRMMPMQEL